MSDPPHDADAALLHILLGMVGGGVMAPRGPLTPELGDQTLDLSADRPAVALSKLRTLGRALGPTLYVQPDARLHFITGVVSPLHAAREFARAQAPGWNNDVRIGVARGEEVLDRLEEFLAAGLDLTGERSLRDASCNPIAAWAPTGVALVEAAFEEGASVVMTRLPTQQSDDNKTTQVELRFAKEYSVVMACSPAISSWLRAFRESPPPIDIAEASPEKFLASTLELRGRVEIVERDGQARLRLVGRSEKNVRAAASRIELFAKPGQLDTPLESRVEPTIARCVLRVPTKLLDFSVDTRPASEWSAG